MVLWLLPSLLWGCAGPTSPFGALEFGSGDGVEIRDVPIQDVSSREAGPRPSLKKEELVVTPKRQVLHMASPLQVGVKPRSPDAAATELLVTYNKRNVTGAFQQYSTRERASGNQLRYVYDKLRLRPDRRHEIDIYTKDRGRWTSHLAFLPPDCPVSQPRAIASVAPFDPPYAYLEAINTQASDHRLSASLLAGLIAQESGFEPFTVSRAKALGLTQVTPLADEELKKIRPYWSRDARVAKLKPAEIEGLIRAKKIGSKQDWRLNPALSIEGGSLYLEYLRDYWNLPENKKILEANTSIPYPEVILASYNSGAARVKSKIKDRGRDWLGDSELKEAFKYVNNVTSYCYHFSKEAQP